MDNTEELNKSKGFLLFIKNLVTTSYQKLQEYCKRINEEKVDLEQQLNNAQEEISILRDQIESSENNAQTETRLMDEINSIEGELAKVTKELS